ncbi:hypothetical protein GRF29_44g994724 [Pseudopithomyces chartarum]|uniref:Uncharacterized protein n=1 Tax=Pseudopithomyces chartarum TaxID=1892770 RepID=A0AAN6RHV4_9PLEO|nr:hypothetical protein GRF29_44g994724 [Pseudopithomyces chartarum]
MAESMMSQSQRHEAFAVAAHIVSDALGNPTLQSAPTDMKEYLRHAERLHTYFREQTETSAIAIRHYAVLQFAQLLGKAAFVCYRQGIFETAFLYLKSAHDAFDANTSDDPSSAEGQKLLTEAARLAYVHGCISTEIGDFQSSLFQFQHAKQCYEKLEQMGSTSLDSKFYTNCIGSSANSLNGLCRDAEAETLYQQFLERGKPDNFTSAYEVNICRCYWSAGKFEKAADRLTKLIQLREGQYGSNDTEDYLMGHMLYCLGNIRISQSRADEAFGLHERALGCWKVTFGEEHHKTGDTYHKVAWHQSRLGDDHSARNNLKEALRVYSGLDRRFRKGEIARSNFKLASVYWDLGSRS